MPTIDSLTERAAPITPDMPVAEVFDLFRKDPDALVFAVVEDDRPVGLVERQTFLVELAGRNGCAEHAKTPIRELMDPEPVTIEASTGITVFSDSMLGARPSGLLRGFIVTDGGRYVGVGTMLSLLQVTSASARRKLEAAADEAQLVAQAKIANTAAAHAKSQFLGVLSHELRTPLNGVLAVAELLQRQPLGLDARAYVQTIVDSSDTLLRTLADAVDLAKAEAGELVLDAQPILIREIMDEVQQTWTPRAAQDGVTLMVSFDGDPDLAAEVDAPRVRQVFNNLIGNALKFAREGVVEASLKASIEGDRIKVEGSVRDKGHGIPEDRLATLFDLQTSSSNNHAGGSGLGLAMCRQAVEMMGGTIRAESNVGRGSTFLFDFTAPRAWIEEEAASNISEISDLHLNSAPHILIVDDNATNRVVAQALCEMFGCTSECAEDGMEAVDAVSNRRFDLILMDIKMPRMDGVQATQAIRALPGVESETPIVALTANADPADAKHYLTIGMASVVEKPIKPERLRAAINAALMAEPAQQAEKPAPRKRAAR
jgi:signal transduction histidine kinase/ActR/RegA family two-component response regulator